MGWRNTLQARLSQAPHFYAAYAVCVAAAAGLVLLPGAPLQAIILAVQVLAGVMLPAAIIFLQLLLNDREMLGERFRQPAMEQLDQLDGDRAAVRAVISACRPGAVRLTSSLPPSHHRTGA